MCVYDIQLNIYICYDVDIWRTNKLPRTWMSIVGECVCSFAVRRNYSECRIIARIAFITALSPATIIVEQPMGLWFWSPHRNDSHANHIKPNDQHKVLQYVTEPLHNYRTDICVIRVVNPSYTSLDFQEELDEEPQQNLYLY